MARPALGGRLNQESPVSKIPSPHSTRSLSDLAALCFVVWTSRRGQPASLDGLFLFNPSDELHANAIGRVGPEPAEQHGGAVAGADQQQEMGRAPEPPSRRTL